MASLGSDPTGSWQDYSSSVGVPLGGRCVTSSSGRLFLYCASITMDTPIPSGDGDDVRQMPVALEGGRSIPCSPTGGAFEPVQTRGQRVVGTSGVAVATHTTESH